MAATQAHLIAMGQLARRCGARVLVLGAPANRRRGDRPMAAALAAAAGVLRPVAEALASTGVSLCIEPNPPAYGCDFVTTAAEAAMLAETVAHANFGVHLDAAALALSGEVSASALAPLMAHVRHFHISEVNLAAVGTTNGVPHKLLASVLRELDYDGWVSIEMRASDDDGWRAALPRALTLAREQYGD